MASQAIENLERPVSFERAAKKLAALRGHHGRTGGWIYNSNNRPICQGWNTYGQRAFRQGLLAQDLEHDGGNGKWYVWVIGLDAAQLQTAERLFGRKPSIEQPIGVLR